MDSFELPNIPDPVLRNAPKTAVGLRLRVELNHTQPPVWRSFLVPGNIHLDTLHALLQAVMGWDDSHLHQFRQGDDFHSPRFLTDFDIVEGEQGIREADVRVDQVLRNLDDQLGYVYDYGDNWEHTLTVEEVLTQVPDKPYCSGGALACPPEDVGGTGMFEQVAAWVRAGYPDHTADLRFEPEVIRNWLPPDWHPDRFSVDVATRQLQEAWVSHIRIVAELNQLLSGLPMFAGDEAVELLRSPAWQLPRIEGGGITVEMLAPFTTFVDVIGEGVKLTATKRLPRAVIKEYAEKSSLTTWWAGLLSSEMNVPPVAEMHQLARDLGLVYVRHGRLLPTARAKKLGKDPAAWVRLIVEKLPLGRKDFDRHAGWVTLLVIGSGEELSSWYEQISHTLADVGWRVVRDNVQEPPPAFNATFSVLETLVRGLRAGWRDPRSDQGLEPAREVVAALARSVVLEQHRV